jgi:hypothetical protein
MQTRNADPITDRGDYALNNDESGLIRGRIVEEPLMGKNAARRFQKELNEIVEDHVPLRFLPVWQKIRIKMQKVIKKHFKKQDLLVRWNKNAVLTSELGLYTRNAFTVEYYTQPAEYELDALRLTEEPNENEDGSDGSDGLEYDKWESRSSLSEDCMEAGDGW